MSRKPHPLAGLSSDPAGRRQRVEMAMIGTELIKMYIFQPRGRPPGALLFVFPGYERNARGYMRRARRIAKEQGLTVIAPDMDPERFPRSRYQRAGIPKDAAAPLGERCMGLFLGRLVAWGRQYVGRADAPYVLFGHSAGAQLLSRIAAFCPQNGPSRIILANPSSYVAPSLIERTPYGFAGIRDVQMREDRLRRYLAQPITIYVGKNDVGDFRLDETAAANRQGRTRFERGLAVFDAGREIARTRGWAFNWRFVAAEGVAHCSKGMLRAPEMAEAIGAERCSLSRRPCPTTAAA